MPVRTPTRGYTTTHQIMVDGLLALQDGIFHAERGEPAEILRSEDLPRAQNDLARRHILARQPEAHLQSKALTAVVVDRDRLAVARLGSGSAGLSTADRP